MDIKLLKRPPFRFLRDTVAEIIKVTGFLDGLFTEEVLLEKDMNKDAKIQFLEKALAATSLATGAELVAKPSKIVAGKEPEQTNAFLQALAAGASAKVIILTLHNLTVATIATH